MRSLLTVRKLKSTDLQSSREEKRYNRRCVALSMRNQMPCNTQTYIIHTPIGADKSTHTITQGLETCFLFTAGRHELCNEGKNTYSVDAQ